MREHIRLSPVLFASLAYGIGGAGFAIANLLLAMRLSPEDFAVFSLTLALVNVAVPIAPLGANVVAVRWSTAQDHTFLRRVVATAALVAAITTALATAFYELGPLYAGVVALGTFFGALTLVAAAAFQERQRFAPALTLTQHGNWVILLAAGFVYVTGSGDGHFVLVTMVAGYTVASMVGLRLRPEPGRDKAAYHTYPWKEAVSIAGVTAATVVLLTVERLMIPKVLSMRDLATYAVLAALAGSPFRILQMGVGYTLMPRLRAAASADIRRRLVAREAALTAIIATAAAVAVWVLAPWVVELFLADKYQLGPALIAAALVAGIGKTSSAFTKAMVTAVGNDRAVLNLNKAGWASLAISIGAGVIGARWGLVGVLFGAATGWIVWASVGLVIALPALRTGLELTQAAAPAAAAPLEELAGYQPGGAPPRSDTSGSGDGR